MIIQGGALEGVTNLIVKHAHAACMHYDLARRTLLTGAHFLQKIKKLSKNLQYASFQGRTRQSLRQRNKSLQDALLSTQMWSPPTPAPENKSTARTDTRQRSLPSG